MIRIEIDKSTVKQKGRSLFLSLYPYDIEDHQAMLKRVDTLPEVYDESDDNRRFQIPYRFFNQLMLELDAWDLEIFGKLDKGMKAYIETTNRMTEARTCSNFEYKTTPFQHQLEAMEFSLEHDSFLLCDEQGLGKTKQAIDIAISRKGGFNHCLIVCCVSGLKWNWAKEVDVHSHEKSHIIGSRINKKGNLVIDGLGKRVDDLLQPHDEFFLITNIETLRDKNFSKTVKQLCISGEIGMVVVDEVHKCKNDSSQQGAALHDLQSYYKLALTGTPLLNTPIDLYNILKWLGFEHHTKTAFTEHYCVTDAWGGITGYKNLPELQAIVNEVMLRRLKEDVLDLPPKLRIREYVDMNAGQAKIYKEVKTKMLEDVDLIRLSNNPLAEFIRLRQATGCPEILSSKETKSSKFERAVEIIAESIATDDKVIVFSNWTKVIYPFIDTIAKYNPAVVTGEVENTSVEIEKFMNDKTCKVICGTIAALGTGYTLTAGSVVIFLDSPWTRGDKDQAEDRAHRIGATKPVTVYTLVCHGTIDERIEDIVDSKGEVSDYIIDGNAKAMKSLGVIDFLFT